ncbi:hypothetical protein AXF42_Ash008540 [Apostasia shenzhenica]|uniref:Uncharacterized protein n=1 Tax=Apostasia shenzhenica TaxID=1088818 RepID=A0A2I0B1P4_9ASPA|nr:hypothetical protein AXF42_Ash008540 [Apostasia shenzhenica]
MAVAAFVFLTDHRTSLHLQSPLFSSETEPTARSPSVSLLPFILLFGHLQNNTVIGSDSHCSEIMFILQKNLLSLLCSEIMGFMDRRGKEGNYNSMAMGEAHSTFSSTARICLRGGEPVAGLLTPKGPKPSFRWCLRHARRAFRPSCAAVSQVLHWILVSSAQSLHLNSWSFRGNGELHPLLRLVLAWRAANSWHSQSPPLLFPSGLLSPAYLLLFIVIPRFAISEDQSTHSGLKLDTLEPEQLDIFPEAESTESSLPIPAERTNGKPGFISFHGLPYERREEFFGSSPSKEKPKIFWFIGPTILVAFLVLPSLYLRRIFSTLFEDSLLTGSCFFLVEAMAGCTSPLISLCFEVGTLLGDDYFLILFFAEALFYGGVAIFVFLVDYIWRPLKSVAASNSNWSKTQFGLRLSSVTTLVLSLIIPLVTMGLVWPWTGPAASATLAPYLVGLVVQFAFEQYAQHYKSPAWPVIPVIFQVYRLHQLNRAAQLVSALSHSVRGAETTSQTLAIHSSLGTLLSVLQILGVICIWSLSSFLMRFLPSSSAT